MAGAYVIKAANGVQVLEVTRTETKVDTYTLEQVDQTIANIKRELANVQARLDYQLALRKQLIGGI